MTIHLNAVGDISAAVRRVTAHVADRVSLSEEREFSIKLVLNELLANCFEHANTGRATVIYRLDEPVLKCCIMDGGNGFARQKGYRASCPCAGSESGRGIFLAQSLSQLLRYNRKGNAVMVRILVELGEKKGNS